MKRISKRLFGILLSLVMAVTLIPPGVITASALAYTTGDIIEFGAYPQSKVTDSGLIAALDAQTLQPDNTVTYAGSKYKKVYFTQYTGYHGGNTTDPEQTYQDDNGYFINTVYWFKYEPIEWRILSNIDGELFVMAEKLLDSRAFNQVPADVTWETCDLRFWLNSEFLNAAFNSTQQAMIKTSIVVNDDTPIYRFGGNDTNDKLFLLSLEEVANPAFGFNPDYLVYDPARMAQGSDFAKSDGLYVSEGGSFVGNSLWMLRSIEKNGDEMGVQDVLPDGSWIPCTDNVSDSYYGIRIAFKTDLADITGNITFDAAGGSGSSISPMIIGETLIAPTVRRAGYTFTGWSPEVPATVPEVDTTYMAQWISNMVTTGDIIQFGSYPQSRVTDAELYSSLNAGTLAEDNTVICEGFKYKRVLFEQYIDYFGGNTTDQEQTYQDDNGYFINTVYWFKYEPIQWRVLSNSNGELFIMAEKLLDSKAYNQVSGDVTWETCDLRFCLNNDFYNTAFNATQQAAIKTSTVVNADNPFFGTEGGNDTNDKLFLLSFSEAANPAFGFSPDYLADDPARMAQGSDFAKSNGLYVYTGSSYLGNSCWWLRSPGDNPYFAGVVCGDGVVRGYGNGGGRVSDTGVGVHPILKLNLTPDIVTSKSGSNCTVDYLNGFIYGLDTGILSLEAYMDVAAGYELSYIPSANGFGTGTIANIKQFGETVESYTIIIFGDVNGNSTITAVDALMTLQAASGKITLEPCRDFAADINISSSISSIDALMILQCASGKISISQNR